MERDRLRLVLVSSASHFFTTGKASLVDQITDSPSIDASQRHDILPGDHVLIPAFVEHQEVSRR